MRRVDGVERTIHVGDKLGTHLGKVEEIGADSIMLIEVHEEPGGYLEKPLRLALEPER